MIYVLYHASCADGFGAAFAAWFSYLGEKVKPVFIPVQYGQPIPAEVAVGATEIYILDFSYPPEEMRKLSSWVKKVVMIDHHKTALERMDEYFAVEGLEFVIDSTKSGAVLAWEYFHRSEEVPEFIRYIQDRDLWQWQLPRSKEFSANLASFPADFATWMKLFSDWGTSHGRRQQIEDGEAILRHVEQQVESQARKATVQHYATPDGKSYHVPVVNAPVYHSEIGHRLLQIYPDAPFAVTFFLRDDGQFVWSLRSEDSRQDVSAIVKQFGGGGHRNAAGFTGVWEQPEKE